MQIYFQTQKWGLWLKKWQVELNFEDFLAGKLELGDELAEYFSGQGFKHGVKQSISNDEKIWRIFDLANCYLSFALFYQNQNKMKALSTLLILSPFIFLLPADAYSQCNTTPCDVPVPQIDVHDACVLPNPAALDCYQGDMPIGPTVPPYPPYWCTTIENNHWFAFTADAATASFEISCLDCWFGNGIQAAVLSTTDCMTFQFVSPCLAGIFSQTTETLTATGLVPGAVYYLMIDGINGAYCDYTINAAVPTITGTTTGVCLPSSPNGTYTTSAVSSWTINPPGAGTIVGNPVSNQVQVIWQQSGPVQICAQNITCPNVPSYCLDILIGEDTETIEAVDLCQGHTTTCAGQTFSSPGIFNVNLPSYLNCDSVIRCMVNLIPKVFTTETVILCQGQSATCAGQEFTSPGNYQVTLPAYQGCDSVVTCKVNLVPTVFTTETVYMCQGQSVTCAGQEFNAPGNYQVTLPTYQGCDSVVTCKVNILPPYVSPFSVVNLCGPAEYQMCDNIFTSSGLYTEICTSSQGCDSIVNVNLAILEPIVTIAPPAILDCDANSIITLNGSGSSVNTAVGGITFYKWSGPGIIGTDNQPTVQVNQPGVYCLVLTHGRGGVYCYDTACVTVTAISAVPQLPLISGSPSPCADSTLIYTATAVGTPPPNSFNWTTPNNIPFTTLSPNSIQITWNGAVTGGQLCVTANNTCGASAPACIPIAVQQGLLQPQMSGPNAVCTGGGAYIFTLDSLQPGTTYSWTTPGGAVLTDLGDTVNINFLNAASGQVCVTAQNTCGTGTPVCQNVQVMLIPVADLTSDGEICAGESINLTFSLDGNAPFDVTWTDGSQNFILNDITNGHTVVVNPAQTTMYRLISVNDNTTPVACASTVTDSVTVTVWQHASLNQAVQICDGETLFVGGAAQSTSGVYVDNLNTVHGCDSIITTTLTVHAIDSLVLFLTTCDPTAAGTTMQVLSQTNGCDSIVTKTVTLLPTNMILIFDTSCDPANVGVFTQNLTNVYGCDSTVVTDVSFSLSDTTLLSASSCDPAATGIFTQNLTTVDGCDSLVITTVSLLPNNTTFLSGISCNPAEVGVFTQNLTNQHGCDSTVTTTVTFSPLNTTQLTATTCDPTAAGVFTQNFTTPSGCDSVVVTTVTLLPSNTTSLFGTSCNPAEVGVFTQNLSNQYECDSTVITTVTFSPLSTVQVAATTCDSTAAGIFTQNFTTPGGCDSVVVTTVSLLPVSTTFLFRTSCNPAEVGVFTQNLTNHHGCDSTVTTTISFSPLSTTQLTATTCDPMSTGVFTQTLVTPQGCDSVIVTTVSLLPSSVTFLSGASCNPAEVGVFTQDLTNQYGCDSTVTTTISFSPLNTTHLTAATCDPMSTGVFTQNTTTPEGCDSIVITTVTLLPSDQIAIQSNTCDPSAAGIFTYNLFNQYGCDSTVTETILLLPSDTTFLAFNTCNPAQTGTKITGLFNQWGCDSTVVAVTSLLPPSSCSVTAGLSGSNIPCGSNTGSLTLTATLGEPPFNYNVLLGGTPVATGIVNAVGVPQIVSGLAAGNYTLNINSINGFSTTAQASIVQLVPPTLAASVVSDYNGYAVSCTDKEDGSVRAMPNGGAPPYSFIWSNGDATQQINNLGAGDYSVTVTDANACTNAATISLNEPAPLNFSFTVNDLDCFGQKDGAIIVEASGGAAPYRYSKDNATFQASNLFSGLTSGTYTVKVLDANDCQRTEIILVNAAILTDVELGDNQTIELGGNTILEAIVNVPLDSILSVAWTPPFDTSECPQCLTQTVAPLISTTYSVQVTALNGCSDQDKVIVIVDRRKHLYVPNVFSPNDDGANDIFSIFAKPGTVRTIKSLQLFDRWGEALYERYDFMPNDPTIGWDGAYREQKMSPGVFVWFLEVEFMDGMTEIFKGDVTLVR